MKHGSHFDLCLLNSTSVLIVFELTGLPMKANESLDAYLVCRLVSELNVPSS